MIETFKTLCTILLLSFGLNCQAQSSLPEIESQLTNNKSKQWILDGATIYMGQKCSGELIVYNFVLKGRKASRKTCLGTYWKEEKLTWKFLVQNSTTCLEFSDGSKFEVQFVKKPNDSKVYLRLRDTFNPSKSETIKDYYFYSELVTKNWTKS